MRFNVDLESQVEAINKEVMDIRLSAQHEMILDDESPPEQVLCPLTRCKITRSWHDNQGTCGNPE